MNIKTYLKNNKMSLATFAEIVGCSQPSVSQYINGNRTPRPKMARRIVLVTNGQVTIDDIYSVNKGKV